MAIYLPRAVADAAKRLADEREAERRRQDALNAPPPVAPPPPRFTSVPQPAAPRFAMPSGPPTGPGVAPLPAGGGFLGGIADAWRGAVPQGVRDTLGAVGQSRVVQEQLEQTGRLFEHIGRPAGAVTAALAGESPSASARGLVEGFRDPVAGVQRGRDIGFVRNLSDDPSASPAFGAGAFGLPGLALGKVAERFGVSPREAVGAAVPIIADPLNFVPGLGPTRQIVRASRGANRAVGRGAVASTLGRGAANERAPEEIGRAHV